MLRPNAESEDVWVGVEMHEMAKNHVSELLGLQIVLCDACDQCKETPPTNEERDFNKNVNAALEVTKKALSQALAEYEKALRMQYRRLYVHTTASE